MPHMAIVLPFGGAHSSPVHSDVVWDKMQVAWSLCALAATLVVFAVHDFGCEVMTPLQVRDAAGNRPKSLVRMSAPGGGLPIPPHVDNAAPEMPSSVEDSAPGCVRPRRGQLLLAVGIITAPAHFDRRLWIRQKLRVSDARCRGVRVLFVLGRNNRMARAQRLAVRHEEHTHGDIVFVNARDWV